MSRWYLRAGRERDNRFALLEGDGVTWTALRDIATSFDTKAEATIFQAEIVAELGIPVACVSEAVTPR